MKALMSISTTRPVNLDHRRPLRLLPYNVK
jgi:hypothetical protein